MSGFVQYGANGAQNIQNLTITLATTATTGNTILFGLTTNSHVSFLTDTAGNVYNAVASLAQVNVWCAYNITGGFTAITATLATSGAYIAALAQEFTGTGTSNPVDLSTIYAHNQTASAAPFLTATRATTQASEIIAPLCFSISGFADPLSGISSPYTNFVDTGILGSTDGSIGGGSNVVSAIVTAVATFSFTTSRQWGGAMISLNLASATPAAAPTHLLSMMGVGG